MSRLILFNKPYGVLSQFTDTAARPTLAAYLPVPGVCVAGRLDCDSEGLLALTDDGVLQAHISHPRYKQPKTYWVQVEDLPEETVLQRLRQGIVLKDGPTLPAGVRLMTEPTGLCGRAIRPSVIGPQFRLLGWKSPCARAAIAKYGA